MKKWAKWRGDTAIVPGPKEAKAKANGLLGLVSEHGQEDTPLHSFVPVAVVPQEITSETEICFWGT